MKGLFKGHGTTTRLTVVLTLATSLVVPAPPAAAARTCGTERWAVKTLSDRDADKVDFQARRVTVRYLRTLSAPDIGPDSPRQRPYEFRTYKVRADLQRAELEDDRDIHLVI